jgi:hypothetical protein
VPVQGFKYEKNGPLTRALLLFVAAEAETEATTVGAHTLRIHAAARKQGQRGKGNCPRPTDKRSKGEWPARRRVYRIRTSVVLAHKERARI